ncbi:MAG: hypothetical protein NVS9B7_02440 [Flavisolibacter sp.]
MVYQTAWLFHHNVSGELIGFVFSGTVCSYNFHWFLTPPTLEHPSVKDKWSINYKKFHLVLFIIGILGAAVFTLLLFRYWIWLLLTAFLTFMYSAPKLSFPLFVHIRKIAIGKTIFLAVAWTHITCLLPMIIGEVNLGKQALWFLLNRFFYIYAICIVFDRRDVAEDRKAGIKSLITLFSEKGIDKLFWSSMIIFLTTLAALLYFFSLQQIIALLVPAIILVFLYYPSKKNHSDYLYYFIVDGLMMMSAPLLLLFKFV